MFQKTLASVQIGAAEVETRVRGDELYPGESFEAQIRVLGGDTKQQIDGLELQLVVHIQEEHSDIGHSKLIDRWGVIDEFTVESGDEEVFPFEGRLHPETPVTTVEARRNLARVWLQPGLEIDQTVDADDTEHLNIAPTEAIEAVLEAVDRSGFYLDRISTDRDRVGGPDWRADLALDQVFEFKPQGRGRSKFDGVALHFVPGDGQTRILMDFDRPHRTETSRTMTLAHEELDIETITGNFQEYLDDV